MSLIEIDNVTKHYRMGENIVKALRGSSLAIKKGEFIAIMGPSGSGKSTLMHIIGVLDTPTEGKVKFEQKKISELNESDLADFRGKKVGFIFQSFNLIHSMTALENVTLSMLFRGVEEEKRKKQATELLKKVGLGKRMDHRPNQLSGGQQQRVSIARALANNPDIILADEPTGEIDSKTGDKIMSMLKKLNKEGKTIILVTHNKHDAQYADRVVNIKDGIITSGEKK